MKNNKGSIYIKPLIGFAGIGFLLMSFSMSSIVGSLTEGLKGFSLESQPVAKETLRELDRLKLLSGMSSDVVAALIDYQLETGKSLAQTLQDPAWCKKAGLFSSQFKVTWYVSNPFQLLPTGLQEAIRKRTTPFKSQAHVWEWCRDNKISKGWRDALRDALVETTPQNLWRASKGKRPFAKNGEYLQPIVIDFGQGRMEVRDGHIATDPRVIPTNSVVYLLLKINGEDKILRVTASDIGGAVKGSHVDLPVQMSPDAKHFPHTRFPDSLKNPSVQILTPLS